MNCHCRAAAHPLQLNRLIWSRGSCCRETEVKWLLVEEEEEVVGRPRPPVGEVNSRSSFRCSLIAVKDCFLLTSTTLAAAVIRPFCRTRSPRWSAAALPPSRTPLLAVAVVRKSFGIAFTAFCFFEEFVFSFSFCFMHGLLEGRKRRKALCFWNLIPSLLVIFLFGCCCCLIASSSYASMGCVL